VFLRHGAAATYHAGWTSNEGRRLNAHNLLLWRGVLALREAGAGWLDLGAASARRRPALPVSSWAWAGHSSP